MVVPEVLDGSPDISISHLLPFCWVCKIPCCDSNVPSKTLVEVDLPLQQPIGGVLSVG